MSVIHSRDLARKIARRRVGVGFVDTRRQTDRIAGMQDQKLKATPRLPETDLVVNASPAPRRVLHERTHGRATRMPPAKNMKTARGWIYHKQIRVYHESELEHRVSLRLAVRNDIDELHSQAIIFNYRDEAGVPRQHTADFLTIYDDGLSQACLVKQESKRKETEDLIARIRMDPSARQVDEIILRTDRYGTIEALENAHMIRWSRPYHDQSEVDELLHLLRDQKTWLRFGSLLQGCGSVPRRRVAIWRLIDIGVLFSITGEKITDTSFLGYAPGGNATGLLG